MKEKTKVRYSSLGLQLPYILAHRVSVVGEEFPSHY
jgi:hypothetical protein